MIETKILRLLKKSTLTESEKELCRQRGVLWEHEPMTHDEIITNIKSAAEKISFEKAAIGFLYSISTGDYRYRTALSSLIWANALPEHTLSSYRNWRGVCTCSVCGARLSEQTGKSVFSETEAHRIRLIPCKVMTDICDAGYVLCDLQYFAKLPDVQYCEEDFRILNRIFGLVHELTASNKVNALLNLISMESTLSLTAGDAFSILGVLSSCGIFDTPEHQSYRSGFVNCSDRGFIYESDMYYPLVHWRGKHGIHYEAIPEVFGSEIAAHLSPETAIRGAVAHKTKTEKPSPAAQFFKDNLYNVTMTDRFRHYYGLQPMNPAWDKVVIYSMALHLPRRMVLFYEGDTIKKFIYEHNNGMPNYLECDTDAKTDHRKLLLPKTARGQAKSITPSLLKTPTYMNAHLEIWCSSSNTHITAWNYSNGQKLTLPPADFKTDAEFVDYTERYIASCPDNYEKILQQYLQ